MARATEVVVPTKEVWLVEDAEIPVALLVLDGDWIDQLYVEPDLAGRWFGSRLWCWPRNSAQLLAVRHTADSGSAEIRLHSRPPAMSGEQYVRRKCRFGDLAAREICMRPRNGLSRRVDNRRLGIRSWSWQQGQAHLR